MNSTRDHFDEIADRYDSEIPEHIRLHLLERKVEHMHAVLAGHLPSTASGLDCGCGTGHYVREMARLGYRMTGFEFSEGMRAQATLTTRDVGCEIGSGSITEIPHPDGSFDFAYAINVLHHLPDKAAQFAAVDEMLRVLKRGGLAFIHDFDADNPVVRFYMNTIFPLTSRIDDDETEIWISPKALERHSFRDGTFVATTKFTLVPNFAPRALFTAFRALEGAAERITGNKFGAHFMTILTRTL